MTDERKAFTPNPLLAGMWGLCPIIAADRSLPEGLALGIGAAFCSLILAGSLHISRGIIPQRLRPIFSLSLSSASAIVYTLLIEIYSVSLSDALWVFLPLLAVCATSLHTIKRCSSGIDGITSKENCTSIVKEAVLFFFTAVCVGAFREILGQGTLSLPLPGDSELRLFSMNIQPVVIFSSPSGGFLLLGLLTAFYRYYLRLLKRRFQ